MSARKRKSALLQAPLPPRVKRLPEKFARNRCQSDTFGTPQLARGALGPALAAFKRPVLILRKVSQRSRARLVAWSVNGGYLRVFEETIEPWRAQRLVRRYVTATNRAFFDLKRPLSRRKRRRVSGAGEVSYERSTPEN
jgi:hypothetical protein